MESQSATESVFMRKETQKLTECRCELEHLKMWGVCPIRDVIISQMNAEFFRLYLAVWWIRDCYLPKKTAQEKISSQLVKIRLLMFGKTDNRRLCDGLN